MHLPSKVLLLKLNEKYCYFEGTEHCIQNQKECHIGNQGFEEEEEEEEDVVKDVDIHH